MTGANFARAQLRIGAFHLHTFPTRAVVEFHRWGWNSAAGSGAWRACSGVASRRCCWRSTCRSWLSAPWRIPCRPDRSRRRDVLCHRERRSDMRNWKSSRDRHWRKIGRSLFSPGVHRAFPTAEFSRRCPTRPIRRSFRARDHPPLRDERSNVRFAKRRGKRSVERILQYFPIFSINSLLIFTVFLTVHG